MAEALANAPIERHVVKRHVSYRPHPYPRTPAAGVKSPRRTVWMKTAIIFCGALAPEIIDIVQKHGWDAEVFGISAPDLCSPNASPLMRKNATWKSVTGSTGC